MMPKVGRETGYLLFSGYDGSKHPWRRPVASVVEAKKPSGEQKDDSTFLLFPGFKREHGMGPGLGCTHLSIGVLSWKGKWHDKEKLQTKWKNVFALNYNWQNHN